METFPFVTGALYLWACRALAVSMFPSLLMGRLEALEQADKTSANTTHGGAILNNFLKYSRLLSKPFSVLIMFS